MTPYELNLVISARSKIEHERIIKQAWHITNFLRSDQFSHLSEYLPDDIDTRETDESDDPDLDDAKELAKKRGLPTGAF
jgi:hypothetical protein